MTSHRYPLDAVAPDYARGVIGLTLSGGAWAMAPLAAYSLIIFGGLTALFLVFTIRTALRHRLRIELTDESIGESRARRGPLPWSEIDDVRLRYYATRRSHEGGWMTLRLAAGRHRLAVDSTLDGFDRIAARAADAARANRIELGATTRANFRALGISADDGSGREAPRDGRAPARAPR